MSQSSTRNPTTPSGGEALGIKFTSGSPGSGSGSATSTPSSSSMNQAASQSSNSIPTTLPESEGLGFKPLSGFSGSISGTSARSAFSISQTASQSSGSEPPTSASLSQKGTAPSILSKISSATGETPLPSTEPGIGFVQGKKPSSQSTESTLGSGESSTGTSEAFSTSYSATSRSVDSESKTLSALSKSSSAASETPFPTFELGLGFVQGKKTLSQSTEGSSLSGGSFSRGSETRSASSTYSASSSPNPSQETKLLVDSSQSASSASKTLSLGVDFGFAGVSKTPSPTFEIESPSNGTPAKGRATTSQARSDSASQPDGASITASPSSEPFSDGVAAQSSKRSHPDADSQPPQPTSTRQSFSDVSTLKANVIPTSTPIPNASSRITSVSVVADGASKSATTESIPVESSGVGASASVSTNIPEMSNTNTPSTSILPVPGFLGSISAELSASITPSNSKKSSIVIPSTINVPEAVPTGSASLRASVSTPPDTPVKSTTAVSPSILPETNLGSGSVQTPAKSDITAPLKTNLPADFSRSDSAGPSASIQIDSPEKSNTALPNSGAASSELSTSIAGGIPNKTSAGGSTASAPGEPSLTEPVPSKTDGAVPFNPISPAITGSVGSQSTANLAETGPLTTGSVVTSQPFSPQSAGSPTASQALNDGASETAAPKGDNTKPILSVSEGKSTGSAMAPPASSILASLPGDLPASVGPSKTDASDKPVQTLSGTGETTPTVDLLNSPIPATSAELASASPVVVPSSGSAGPAPASNDQATATNLNSPASTGGKPAVVIQPSISLPSDSATTAGAAIISPVIAPSPGNANPSAASNSLPTATNSDSLASTGGKPSIVVQPSASSPPDSATSTGGVPAAVVSPPGTQGVAVPSSTQPPASLAGSITFGPAGIFSTSTNPNPSEPGVPAPSGKIDSASPSNSVSVELPGIVLSSGQPSGVLASIGLPAPVVTPPSATATASDGSAPSLQETKASSSAYDALNPGSGQPAVTPTNAPNSASEVPKVVPTDTVSVALISASQQLALTTNAPNSASGVPQVIPTETAPGVSISVSQQPAVTPSNAPTSASGVPQVLPTETAPGVSISASEQPAVTPSNAVNSASGVPKVAPTDTASEASITGTGQPVATPSNVVNSVSGVPKVAPTDTASEASITGTGQPAVTPSNAVNSASGVPKVAPTDTASGASITGTGQPAVTPSNAVNSASGVPKVAPTDTASGASITGTGQPAANPSSSAYNALTSALGPFSPPASNTGLPPTNAPKVSSGLGGGVTASGSNQSQGPGQTSVSLGTSGASVPLAGPSDSAAVVSGHSGSTAPGGLVATATDASLTAPISATTGGPSANVASPLTSHVAGPTATAGTVETPPIAISASPSESPVVVTNGGASASRTDRVVQQATGTDTLTAQTIPSSIVADPTASQPTASTDFGPTGIPSDVPHIIAPSYGVPTAPPNTTLIQIGFLYPLNYAFVLANPLSQRQIFKFLPMGIAYGLDLPVTNVTMQTLRAYDTKQELGFITTLAMAYIPADQVDLLNLEIRTAGNKIYNNPDDSVRTIMSMINPAIPILSSNMINGAPTTGGGNAASPSSSGSVHEGAPIGGNTEKSEPIRGTSVGIAAGVVCGAAAYGAAMFFVARRYRKRKQSHRRSPSMLNSPVMSGIAQDFVGGANTALMSGGRGDADRSVSPFNGGYYYGRDSRGSGRSGSTGRQQISAPVMAENSLGWN